MSASNSRVQLFPIITFHLSSSPVSERIVTDIRRTKRCLNELTTSSSSLRAAYTRRVTPAPKLTILEAQKWLSGSGVKTLQMVTKIAAVNYCNVSQSHGQNQNLTMNYRCQQLHRFATPVCIRQHLSLTNTLHSRCQSNNLA